MQANRNGQERIIRPKAGPIPNDWRAVHISDVARVNELVLPEDTDSEYCFRYLDLASVREGHFSLPGKMIRFADAPSRARRVLRQGDVIMATVRPNLRGYARVRFDPKDVVCSTGFAVITPAKSTDGEYLYQSLYSTAMARQLHGLVVGSGYPAISGGDVERLCIGYPTDQRERRRIGALLHSWDQAIDLTQSLLKLKRKLKRGLMQHLLAYSHHLRSAQRSWRTCHLGDLLRNVNRHVNLHDGTRYRLVSIRRRSGGFFDREPLHGRDIGYSKLKTIRTGDFVIARRQVIHGAMAVAKPEFDGAYVSDSYATLVPIHPERLHMPFLDYLSQTPQMYYKAFRCSYGVAIEKMFFDLDWFLNEEITVPPSIEEQRKIASIFEAADREIALLKRNLDLLRVQKRGLMQKLLTGQIRVKVDKETGNG